LHKAMADLPFVEPEGGGSTRGAYLTIQIDDSGWGDLLDGVVIVAYRKETEQLAYRIIDLSFFKDPLFDQKNYLTEASRLVQELLEELKATKNELIEICTGYVLSRAVIDLHQAGFTVRTTKIVGPLQYLGESIFLEELRKIGYTPIEDRELKRVASFYHMLRWMNEKPERRQLAKTGWSFFTGKPKREWRRWGDYDEW